MKNPRWTIEQTLYILAFLLALGVRVLRLGAVPLSDFEAGWALQALDVSGRGVAEGQAVLGPNPGYGMITGLLFALFGSSDGLARFWPALAGALLPWVPAFFRKELGQKAALILAFGLALDPGLVAVSRTAGGVMPAISLGLLALGAAYRRQAILAGILGGLALISGPAVLVGLLGIALSWGLIRLLEKVRLLEPWHARFEGMLTFRHNGDLENEAGAAQGAQAQENVEPDSRNQLLRLGLYFLAGTALLAGTLFFRFPQGLGALAGTPTFYLGGWAEPSGVPALRLPAALLFYQPLPLFFGLAAAVQGWLRRHERYAIARRLSLWVLVTLLLSMLYPARQVSDLIWVLVPLWALAALELAQGLALEDEGQNRLIVSGQAVLLFVLLAFAWNYLLVLSSANQFGGVLGLRNMLVLLIGAGGMAILTTVLVALGWTWTIARQGLSWGLSISLGIYMLSAMWSASQLRASGEQELWNPAPASGQAGLLVETLSDISLWQTGHRTILEVVVLADSPSLRWELRTWPNVRYASNLSTSDLPSAIIAYRGQEPPALAASYRGQDFSWQVYPAWRGVLPADLPRWLAFRSAPAEQNEVIVWVRADLFPGGTLEPQADVQIVPEEESLP